MSKNVDIKFKNEGDENWETLNFDRSFLPSSFSDECVAIEIREHLYARLDESGLDQEALDELIDRLEFKRGSLWNEAVFAYNIFRKKDAEDADLNKEKQHE